MRLLHRRQMAFLLILVTAVLHTGCRQAARPSAIPPASRARPASTPSAHPGERPRTTPERIVAGGRLEVHRRVGYDSRYRAIPYPNGDIPQDRGVCTDLVVRALRAGGYDLQRLIHEDKRAHPAGYPRVGGSRRSDANIDHRRTPNHLAFFRRRALVLTNRLGRAHLEDWQPGDLVYLDLGGGVLHCGVVSDRKNPEDIPLLIHNIGPTASEEDCLARWRIIGHFRFPPSAGGH